MATFSLVTQSTQPHEILFIKLNRGGPTYNLCHDRPGLGTQHKKNEMKNLLSVSVEIIAVIVMVVLLATSCTKYCPPAPKKAGYIDTTTATIYTPEQNN